MALEYELTARLKNTVEAAREQGYTPSYFLQMLEQYGGLETARRLLSDTESQTGLYKLWELNLLHESMEAVVLQDRFRPLFTVEELREAERRLDELGYSP